MDAMKDQARHVIKNNVPRDWTWMTDWLNDPAVLMLAEVIGGVAIILMFILFALIPV